MKWCRKSEASCYNKNEADLYPGGMGLAKKRKQQFTVEPNESLADCLERMKAEGYRPVRRIEKPVFKESGSKEPVISHQQILFEGILEEGEQ